MQSETRMLCLKPFREDTKRTQKEVTDKFDMTVFHATVHVRNNSPSTGSWDNWEMRGNTYWLWQAKNKQQALPQTRCGFPTCWRGWDGKQRLFVPLVLRCPFALLPSQLAARSRPTPQYTEQPIRDRLSILTPPSPVQPPGLQNHTTGAGKILERDFHLVKTW